MLVPVLLFALGLVLLIKGGDWFVDGATGLARRFHIPEIIVGATVVSIGTTLPEVMVSATCYFTEDYRFALDRFQSRKRTGSGYGLAHHLFYIRVPLTARRALANPFGRVLSAVATYIYSLFFHTAKVWKYFFISFPNSQICFLLSLHLSEHLPDNTHRPGQHTCGTSSVRFLFHHLG